VDARRTNAVPEIPCLQVHSGFNARMSKQVVVPGVGVVARQSTEVASSRLATTVVNVARVEQR